MTRSISPTRLGRAVLAATATLALGAALALTGASAASATVAPSVCDGTHPGSSCTYHWVETSTDTDGAQDTHICAQQPSPCDLYVRTPWVYDANTLKQTTVAPNDPTSYTDEAQFCWGATPNGWDNNATDWGTDYPFDDPFAAIADPSNCAAEHGQLLHPAVAVASPSSTQAVPVNRAVSLRAAITDLAGADSPLCTWAITGGWYSIKDRLSTVECSGDTFTFRAPGTYTVSVKYADNGFGRTAIGTATITVVDTAADPAPVKTVLTTTGKTQTLTAGGSFTGAANLVRADTKAPIAGATLAYTRHDVTGSTLARGTTSSKGTATATVKSSTSRPGYLHMQWVFDGGKVGHTYYLVSRSADQSISVRPNISASIGKKAATIHPLGGTGGLYIILTVDKHLIARGYTSSKAGSGYGCAKLTYRAIAKGTHTAVVTVSGKMIPTTSKTVSLRFTS